MVRRALRESFGQGLQPKRLISVVILFSLLIFSVTLIKTSIRDLGPDFGDWIKSNIKDIPSAIGLSWLVSFFILSGSPVAAIAIGLQNAGIITPLQLFASILGSRIGAVSIAFFVGLITVFEEQSFRRGFSVAVTAFLITLTMSFGTLIIGLMLFPTGAFLSPQIDVPIFDPLGPITKASDFLIQALNPSLALFIGMVMIVMVVRLLDRTLGKHKGTDQSDSWIDLLNIPSASFIAGFLLTAVTFTVSVSFSIIVPIYVAQKVELKKIIPYIIGSNIGTFSDTLILAALTGTAETVKAVMLAILGSCLVAAVLMRQESIDTFVNLTYRLLAHEKNIVLLLAALAIFPLLLIAL